jgi:chromosome segregation ATPase
MQMKTGLNSECHGRCETDGLGWQVRHRTIEQLEAQAARNLKDLNQMQDELRSAQASLFEAGSQQLELQQELATCHANMSLIEAQLKEIQIKMALLEEEKSQWCEERTMLTMTIAKLKGDVEMKVLQMAEKDAKIHELQTKQASMTDELKKATENETSAVTVLKAANEVP